MTADRAIDRHNIEFGPDSSSLSNGSGRWGSLEASAGPDPSP